MTYGGVSTDPSSSSSMALQPLWALAADQPVARPLPTHRTTQAVAGDEWLASRSGRFATRGRVPATYCIGN
jgi:hypothetical protein